jgi:hypothetical protein
MKTFILNSILMTGYHSKIMNTNRTFYGHGQMADYRKLGYGYYWITLYEKKGGVYSEVGRHYATNEREARRTCSHHIKAGYKKMIEGLGDIHHA